MSATTATSGLTRRRGGGGSLATGTNGNGAESFDNVGKDSAPETSYEQGDNGHKIAFDPRDLSESAERSKQPKLTLMEEVLLLGLKDKQVGWIRGESLGAEQSLAGFETACRSLPCVKL